MKRQTAAVISLAMSAMLCAFPAYAKAEAEAEKSADFLEALTGTYDELFTVICDPKYDQLWLDDCTEIVGEEMAGTCAEMLKSACTGEIYGQEAVDAYGDGSEAKFDCYFINGISQFTFDGNVFSGTDEDGKEVFSHTYEYVEPFVLGGMMEGSLYETKDEDAGEFTYFVLFPDTPESTYHIEFRYGSDKDALAEYNTGAYAYWLAAGIPADADQEMIENVIRLFTEENLSEMAEEGAGAEDEEAEESGEELTEEVIEIDSAEALAAVNENLSGNYLLTADIDLGGEEWTPLGSFAIPEDAASEEEMAIPSDEIAFTGTFDGGGHTISNFVINQPESFALGLFGCVANADVGNFSLENVTVDGSFMFGAAVGYAFCSEVHDITVRDAVLNAHATELSGEGMYGAVVGAGMMSTLTGCTASAAITVPDETGNIGIVAGGMEMTSLIGCSGSGSITAGSSCYGIGGVSGCGFGTEEFTDCRAIDVAITAGDHTRMVGGVTGYAGGFEDESAGIPVTVFTGCTAENVTFDLGEDSEEAGEIVGSGFYSEEAAKAYGAPYDAPTVFVIK